MNQLVLVFQKCLILGFLLFHAIKYLNAKRYDETLTTKMDIRSWMEVAVVLLGNAAFMVLPVTKDSESRFLTLGLLMIFLTFALTYRHVAVGRNLIFAQQRIFDLRQITKKDVKDGRLQFTIRGVTVRIFMPVGDVRWIMERLSGRKRQKRR